MGAASYIGRIGGLAVALGVGTAIITGQGVANATPDGQDSQDGSSQSGDQNGANTGTPKAGGFGGLGKIAVKHSPIADIVGRHRASDTSPSSVTATSIVQRVADAAKATAKRVADTVQNGAGATNGDKTSPLGASRLGGSSSRADRVAAWAERVAERTSSPGTSLTDRTTDTNNVTANEFVGRAPAIKEWLASPRVVAGRAGDTASTVSTQTSLWTPPRFLTGQGPLLTMKAAPATTALTALRAPNLLTSVLGDVFNPFAGTAPHAPTPDSPLSLMLLGASRREIGVDAFTSQSLLAPADSLAYAPVVEMVNGVMTYENPNPPDSVTYTVVKVPSGGGKVLLDPATGSFSFLPDFSSVKNGTPEDFSVLVAETTPFDAALTQIPLIGSFVPQILVVLHQIPIVNVVLAPLIGRSAVVPVTVVVGTLAPSGTPVAFTVKVPSPVDGALISTNYFPATTVVNGPPGTTAPTILNGPGLAIAGNTDPNSVSIGSSLDPGLEPLRDAGYNVVTWDPRGEFASGGVLQLDSPTFEGQDVKGIIDWLTANSAYTHPAFDDGGANPPAKEGDTNDPAIGMVGGSYGGGIQLVTAGIDPRVDVIVPGIAWNNLEDSLYTNGAFKTSYSAGLLLGLVTTGARINPQIYPGIITGALLGILTPGQISLLRSSGPDFLTANIDIPTLFIQGTVDVLFPLQQAVTNAGSLGTPTEDIRMIWFCGGHGVCLTMNQQQIAEQNQMLLSDTLNWLDHSLMDKPLTGATFQFVDQNGQWYTADLLPIDDPNPNVDDFYTDSHPIVTDNGGGGLLGIVPLLGGSGPESAAPLPYSLGLGSQASNAINIPLNDASDGTTVVGAPHLTFNYAGIGTSRSVDAQIVDRKTGLVVGNIVTPIPVSLDGGTHAVDISMEQIVYTYGDSVPDGADLELQIVGSATPYLNLTQFGFINVSNVAVSLPTPGPDADVTEETLSPVSAAV
jgi:ABC-2 type transport system ATP-binding protein